MDPNIQATQYGFRRKRGTHSALHCTRRLITFGEGTKNPVYLVLLDWEKAFDKISHEMLFKSLTRMGVHQIIGACIKLYDTPQFRVKLDGTTSDYYTQHTGIRQGCPLSPYLFIIVMTCIFEDVHTMFEQNPLQDSHVSTANFSEVLFADDTICMTSCPLAMNRLLAGIEQIRVQYGLHSNKNTCDYIVFNDNARVHVMDGAHVPMQTEAKYLGCWLNNKGDPTRELKTRMAKTAAIWKKLQLLMLHANDTYAFKVHVYNAVVKAKLLYGLDSVEFNDQVKEKLDISHRRGLRQIFNIPTTYTSSPAGKPRHRARGWVPMYLSIYASTHPSIHPNQRQAASSI